MDVYCMTFVVRSEPIVIIREGTNVGSTLLRLYMKIHECAQLNDLAQSFYVKRFVHLYNSYIQCMYLHSSYAKLLMPTCVDMRFRSSILSPESDLKEQTNSLVYTVGISRSIPLPTLEGRDLRCLGTLAPRLPKRKKKWIPPG